VKGETVPTVINPLSYIIGAAEVYYRAIGSTAAWTSIGSTVDDIVFRVNQSTFNPSDTINGLDDLIYLMDYKNGSGAEAEFTMPEIAGPKLALAIPGAVSTTLATTDAGGTPFTSTLAAASLAGATNIKVVAVTNLTPGDYVRFDVTAGGLAEYRVIDIVGTAGAGGTGITFRDPLVRDHANGVAAVEAVGDGKTEVTGGSVRRMPSTAYNDWALVAQSPADYYELFLYRGISTTDAVEFSFGDETMAGIRVTIGARKDGSNLALPSWKLRVPAA
jgi:hypothetical protein